MVRPFGPEASEGEVVRQILDLAMDLSTWKVHASVGLDDEDWQSLQPWTWESQ